MKTDILSLDFDQLTTVMCELEQSPYRAKQLFEWLHKRRVSDFSEMTNLSVAFREVLEQRFCINSLKIKEKLVSNRKDTVKYLYKLSCGQCVETVHMVHNHGNSICVSSQVGCRMGCKFCASGVAGFVRNLTPSEMLLQIYETERQGNTVDSVVIMGIGEPLDNYDNVVKFIDILQHRYGFGLGRRAISLSTCGLADEINKLATLQLGLTLSVSLHAVSDDERSAIMPVNRKYGLERLLRSCADYFAATGRRISFEYALIAGVNDDVGTARRLVRLLFDSPLPKGSCYVNLIPVNEIDESGFMRSSNAEAFAAEVRKSGITATVRRTMGSDIDAACGQLRVRNAKSI